MFKIERKDDKYLVTGNGRTRTYKSVSRATQVFRMLTDEQIGYENAHDPNFTPKNDDQANGVEQWFEEQEATAAALKEYEAGLMIFA